MLRSTFQYLVRGINPEREAKLWEDGIHSWEEFDIQHPIQQSLFPEFQEHSSPLASSRTALMAGDVAFFANTLKPREHFRIPLEFPEKTLFLDIETTGLSRHYDVITLVGWSYQDRYHACIRGQDDNALRTALIDAKIVVTFNGSIFDLPFLRIGFSDLELPPVHIDLRFLAKRVGLSGGQKAIEEILGFKRRGVASEIKGEAAPVLWHRYRRGDIEALKLLIEYNHYDIEGMRYIFDKVVSKLLKMNNVPKRICHKVPVFSKPSTLRLVNGEHHSNDENNLIFLPAYRGPIGPSISLKELLPENKFCDNKIVGIDLTGSAARPTGWCLLEGKSASTTCLGTDEELIQATLQSSPHVVSIDSPLSLPRGRISAFDDDPGRKEFGIMRYCERVLKKRGINVYPALIPSMQRLTDRGIKLAAEFRARGIPVIESYPGAAQDIMGIPRKRASLEMLRQGLNEFGVTGEFLERQVSHDELDAITAAIVGAFFWGGRFEALGIEEEEALIIPDLARDPKAWVERRVIGISGPLAAGKTTAARYLENSGYAYTRYSMVLESLRTVGGAKQSRPELQEFGSEIHIRYGQRWLGRRLLESLPKEGSLVIDGLRFPDDHAFLIECFGPAFLHVHVTAQDNIREVRFLDRETSQQGFIQSECHPVESRVKELRNLAHIEVVNDATLESFEHRIAVLGRISRETKSCQ
jgi:uncharacterized protein YprB with RNaseH-like and TPR domain/predicted nuclease with RNAse H fold